MNGKTKQISALSIGLVIVTTISVVASFKDVYEVYELFDTWLQNHWFVSGLLLVIVIGLFILTYLILSVKADGESGRKKLHDKVDDLNGKVGRVTTIAEMLAKYHEIDISIAKLSEKESSLEHGKG